MSDIDRLYDELAEIVQDREAQRHWRRRAACLGLPVELFFPERGDNESAPRARQVCAGCPVQAECERDDPEVMVEGGHMLGFYHGLSGVQRKAARKRRLRGDTPEAA